MRQISIDELYCKGCHLCIDQCPNQVLEVSDARNIKGYLLPKAAQPENCEGCLICEMICPDMAITIAGVNDEN